MNTLTITDGPHAQLPLRGMAVALLVWFGGIALFTLVFDPSTVVVFGSERGRLAAVDAIGAPMLSAGRGFITVRIEKPGAVRALYAHGAWFVWPAMRAGCTG